MKYLPFLLALLPVSAEAAAWLHDKGQGEAIVNLGYYFAHNSFDRNGERYDIPLYSKIEINPYAEYGLTEDITIGGSFAAKRASNEFSNKEVYGLDDISIFARTYLYNGSVTGSDSFVISAPPGFYLPMKLEGEINQQSGVSPSIKLSIGYGTEDYFAELITGYEYWSGSSSDRITTQVTFGYDLTESFTVIGQVFTTNVIDTDFTKNSNYNLVKLQPSILWKYDDKITYQLGLNYDVSGRNTGAGYGFLYSVWYKF